MNVEHSIRLHTTQFKHGGQSVKNIQYKQLGAPGFLRWLQRKASLATGRPGGREAIEKP